MARQGIPVIFHLSIAVILLAVAVSGGRAQAPLPPGPAVLPPTSPPTPTQPPSPQPQFPTEPPQSWFSTLFPFIRPASGDSSPSPLGTSALRSVRPELLGDLPPLPVVGFTPNGTPVVLPSVRDFKVSDFESPEPQDRTFVNYNYYNNLYGGINQRFGADVHNIQVSKETVGFEKTFCEDAFSVEARLPIYTTSAEGSIPGLNGSATTVGDLSLLAKFAIVDCPESDVFVSGGLAVTIPTGPDSLFDSPIGSTEHCATLQPFLGYKWDYERWDVLGFIALDVPTDQRLATLLFNDLSIHYTLYENQARGAVVNAVVPLGELHVTTPLSHRGILSATDPNGTPDMVDFTLAVEVRLLNRFKLVVGVAAPVVGPSPMGFEGISQFKVIY